MCIRDRIQPFQPFDQRDAIARIVRPVRRISLAQRSDNLLDHRRGVDRVQPDVGVVAGFMIVSRWVIMAVLTLVAIRIVVVLMLSLIHI